MSANSNYVITRGTSRKRAAKLAAGGATMAFVLAGMAVPVAHAETITVPGPCTTSSSGEVTCIYDHNAAFLLHIPAGVTSVHIDARGAAGGNGGVLNSRRAAPRGGAGGMVAADFPVAPGDVLRISVGQRGKDADGLTPGLGGQYGGADGGAGAPAGGGGGGSSSVSLNGSGPDSRILVAGGGGGAGGAVSSTEDADSRGGAGGGDRGEDGGGDRLAPSGLGAVGPSGGAGLQRILGLDGHSGYDAEEGGQGGRGGNGTSHCLEHAGTWGGGPVGAGGGGGGYAGGGGGSAGATIGSGGGGGSGFVATSFLAPTVARLGSAMFSIGKGSLGDGLVVITYHLPRRG